MHSTINNLLERYQEFGELLKEERECITSGKFDELGPLLEKKTEFIKDIDQMRQTIQLPLSLDGQAKDLQQLMINLKIMEDENIALLQDELDKVRKERSDVKTTANVLKNYQQNGVQEHGVPKFFDKKK